MKRINYFYCVLLCLLSACFIACNEENQLDTDVSISSVIKDDFSKRFPSGKILKIYRNDPSGFCQIDFIDGNQNEVSAMYKDEIWEMTYTKIDNINRLPIEVKRTFEKVYGDAKTIENIYQTKQKGIEWSTYTIHFLYPTKMADNVTHNVIINDDGLFLKTFTYNLIDPRLPHFRLFQDHLDFIAEKYKGAEIRGYLLNQGKHEYFIRDKNVIKSVVFDEESALKQNFWKETRYELSMDANIPDNVLKYLKKVDPDFTYTNIYCIETNQGNVYEFIDKKTINDFGYSIGDNVGKNN